MTKTYIAMTSITYAYKAKTLFERNGIRCDVVRTPKNLGSGCGYSIAVRTDAERAAELLDKHKIPHKSSYEI